MPHRPQTHHRKPRCWQTRCWQTRCWQTRHPCPKLHRSEHRRYPRQTDPAGMWPVDWRTAPSSCALGLAAMNLMSLVPMNPVLMNLGEPIGGLWTHAASLTGHPRPWYSPARWAARTDQFQRRPAGLLDVQPRDGLPPSSPSRLLRAQDLPRWMDEMDLATPRVPSWTRVDSWNCHRRACALLRPGRSASRDQIWAIVQRGRAEPIGSLRSVAVTTVTLAACHTDEVDPRRGQPCWGVAVTGVHCADHAGNEPGWRPPGVVSPRQRQAPVRVPARTSTGYTQRQS